MVVTNNKSLFDKIVTFKSQGLDIKKPNNYYNHEVVGYNYRMTNICAAIGFAQLSKINDLIKQKKRIFILYKNFLKKYDVKFQKQLMNTISTYWLVTILLKKKSKWGCKNI